MFANLSPATAQAIYGIITAAIPLLILAGFLTPDSADLWLGLVAAILGLAGSGIATARVSAQRKDGTLPS